MAQLGAEAAIGPLIEMLPVLDDLQDDWFLEEFPQAFALIGPASLAPLAATLVDAGNPANDHNRFASGCGSSLTLK